MKKAITTKKYKVENMRCVSCAMLIEEELETTHCADSATCNYASSELTLESQNQIDDEKVIDVVSKLGYKIHPKE